MVACRKDNDSGFLSHNYQTSVLTKIMRTKVTMALIIILLSGNT